MEEKGKYITDETEDALEMLGKGYEPQEIVDESDLRKYRIELPNLYDDAGLDTYEFRLLAHYKRVGTCTESTRTTAKKCRMSPSQVSDKRKSLSEKGFIVMVEVPLKDNNFSYSITVVDRWRENFEKYSARSHSEHPRPHSERGVRTAKQRINHIKKEPIKNGADAPVLTPEDYADVNSKMESYLQLSQAPGMKKMARQNAILSYLGPALGINSETKRWKQFAEFVDERQQLHGEMVEVFIGWVTSQPKYDIQFWPPSRMMELWPQAFRARTSAPEPPQQKTELERFLEEEERRKHGN